MKNKEFKLEGLTCANCADKIEKKLQNTAGIEKASLNFATKKLIVESDEKEQSLIKKINKISNDIEPGVYVLPPKEEKGKRSENLKKYKYLAIILGIILFLIAIIFDFSIKIEFILFAIAYLLISWEILLISLKNITKGNVFDENFLMSIATISAICIGSYSEAVAVMLFYQIGIYFEDKAVEKSRKSIADLMNIRQEYANLEQGGIIKKVSPSDVKVGDIIIVKPGEKIPLDGIVSDGKSILDVSSLTGESAPYSVYKNSKVLSGSINKNGLISVKVTSIFSESTVTKILNLVENAGLKKSKTEKFITKFARYYTPAVVFAALCLAILPPLIIKEALFSEWIYKAVVFLVISCPCALVISIPLTFFAGIGNASRNGILIKGSNYLEALNTSDTFVFDKTGTLTKGVFNVTKIVAEKDFNDYTLLQYAAFAESNSNHPIAKSIVRAYGQNIDKKVIKSYNEISGYGIEANIEGKDVLAGNYLLLEKNDVSLKKSADAGTVVYIAVDKVFAGYIVISDEIKSDSKNTIQTLKNIGVSKIAMLTGDTAETASAVAKELEIDEFYSNLLPYQKIEKIEEIKQKGKVVFVGDGINDAPVLAGADVGISMGGLGSDAAIEASDIVLMTDEPFKLIKALEIAKNTKIIVWQNIVLALGVKGLILVLGAFGMATMWQAVFADVGVTLIAVLNSLRALK